MVLDLLLDLLRLYEGDNRVSNIIVLLLVFLGQVATFLDYLQIPKIGLESILSHIISVIANIMIKT
jgi:hypothetical protein